MENQPNKNGVWVNGNRKYFLLDDGTVMHRPLTIEERMENNPHADLKAFKLFIGMEEAFGNNALKVIQAFKKI